MELNQISRQGGGRGRGVRGAERVPGGWLLIKNPFTQVGQVCGTSSFRPKPKEVKRKRKRRNTEKIRNIVVE